MTTLYRMKDAKTSGPTTWKPEAGLGPAVAVIFKADKGIRMTNELSMEAIVARLEKADRPSPGERGFHAEQGSYHGERQALHAAEAGRITRRCTPGN